MKKFLAIASIFGLVSLNTATVFAASTFTGITATAQTGSLTSGTAGSATYTITVNRTGSGNLDVVMSVLSGLPSGAIASFSPSTVSFTGNTPASKTSVLTITTTVATPAGAHPLVIRGVDGVIKTTPATLTISSGQANQTITFDALPDKTYGDADFSVSATASSELTPTFTASPAEVCTVTGTLVHIVGAGDCTITAHQAGNEAFNPAPDVPNTFTILPAVTLESIAITTPATKLVYTVGDALDIAGMVVTGTYSDTTTAILPVISSDVTGFDSSAVATEQSLTVTYGGKSTTYAIDVNPSPTTVAVTPATGGSSIGASTTGGSWTLLFGPILSETSAGSIGDGTIVLDAPAGFEFDTAGVSPTVLVTRIAGTGTSNKNINNLTSLSTIPVVVSSSQLGITITSHSQGNVSNSLTWQNIRVRPTAVTPLATGNITNSGTATITGVNGSTNLGHLVEIDDSPKDSSKEITSFTIPSQDGGTVIDQDAHTITLTVPFGTDKTGLVATFVTTGASVAVNSNPQTSGATANDFTNPVTYTVTASDESTQEYAVTVITAEAPITTHRLTYTAGVNGMIEGDSPQTVNHGTSGTSVTAIPDTGFHFVNWNDGVTANPRTDTEVTNDVTVTANFTANDPAPVVETAEALEFGGAGGTNGIPGCKDQKATNYDPTAVYEGPCTYPETGEVLGVSTSTLPIGEVLGASTSSIPLTCGEYLGFNPGSTKKALREGAKNDPTIITLLQQYLNESLGSKLPTTGFFGPMTTKIVKQYQALHKDTILTPWGLTKPTGIVYLTTVAHINNSKCSTLGISIDAKNLVPALR